MTDPPDSQRERRGQVTLGTLVVFLSMVFVAAIAAMVLLTTAGAFQTKAEMTAEGSSQQVTGSVHTLEVVGLKTASDGDDEIGGLVLVVARGPGSGDVNLTRTTLQWVDDTGTYDLAHERAVDAGTATVDGEFVHVPIRDDDNSLSAATLNDREDRARVVVDIGQSESSGPIAEPFDSVAARTTIRTGDGGLEPGESAVLRFSPAAGTGRTVRVVVPDSIDGGTALRL